MKSALTGCLILLAVCISTVYGQSEPQAGSRKIGSVFRSPQIPGWLMPGEADLRNYEIYLDRSVKKTGEQSVSLKAHSSESSAPGSTILIQYVRAVSYNNRRVRLTAFVKSEGASRANLFVRMDGDGMIVMNEDHMPNRQITGSTDWTEYQIVLDVPSGAQQLVLGIQLTGSGQIWVDDMRFEIVGESVPVTGIKDVNEIQAGSAAFIDRYKQSQSAAYGQQLAAFLKRSESLPDIPQNLDFEN